MVSASRSSHGSWTENRRTRRRRSRHCLLRHSLSRTSARGRGAVQRRQPRLHRRRDSRDRSRACTSGCQRAPARRACHPRVSLSASELEQQAGLYGIGKPAPSAGVSPRRPAHGIGRRRRRPGDSVEIDPDGSRIDSSSRSPVVVEFEPESRGRRRRSVSARTAPPLQVSDASRPASRRLSAELQGFSGPVRERRSRRDIHGRRTRRRAGPPDSRA
jgi:hypothetical protein